MFRTESSNIASPRQKKASAMRAACRSTLPSPLKSPTSSETASSGENHRGSVTTSEPIRVSPRAGTKKIKVTGRIHDKYSRRDKPYMVIEATAVDEDGRMIERLRTYQLKKPEELGKKWHPQS